MTTHAARLRQALRRTLNGTPLGSAAQSPTPGKKTGRMSTSPFLIAPEPLLLGKPLAQKVEGKEVQPQARIRVRFEIEDVHPARDFRRFLVI
jgi:hypothetical protein